MPGQRKKENKKMNGNDSVWEGIGCVIALLSTVGAIIGLIMLTHYFAGVL